MVLVVRVLLLLLVACGGCCCCCAATEQQQQQEQPKQPPILNITSRVVGGTPVQSTSKYPFFIEWEDAKCGASLIHDDIALSAAHCENTKHPFDTRIFLLGLNTQGGIPRFIERQVAHPLYEGGGEDYDFLLLKLSESALVDANGNPTGAALVELNTDPTIPLVGDALTAMGFGKTNQDATETSPVFNEVEIYYIDDETCRQQYGVGDYLKELMFCAGVPEGGKDTCQGDSGGPILHQVTGKQVGLVSYGIGCALPDYSGVNSRVSAVQHWIQDQICELSDMPPARCLATNGSGSPTTLLPEETLPPGGLGALSVHIQYDQYPEETAWSLTYLTMPADQDPIRIFLSPFSQDTTIADNDYRVESFSNLPSGTYSLQIGDQAGDGICCSFGNGQVWVMDDTTGQQLWSTNQYTDYVEVLLEITAAGVVAVSGEDREYDNSWESFDAPNHPPTYDEQWPGALPSIDRFAVAINVKFDYYTEEIDWDFSAASSDTDNTWSTNPLEQFDGETQGVPDTLVSVEIDNLSEGWHRFSITDSQGDGICCSYRRGWASITGPIITTRRKGLVWGNNGEFQSGVDVYLYMDSEGFVSQVSYSDPLAEATQRNGGLRNKLPGERRDLELERLRQLSLSTFTELPKQQLKQRRVP